MDHLGLSALLGLLEGLTEFIPVSSTGHLLLASHFLGFDSAGKTFEVVIQLGAVLAILTVYFGKLVTVFGTAHRDPAAFRFIISVLLAFLPEREMLRGPLFLILLVFLAVVIGVVESVMARLKMLHIPYLLISALLFCSFAFILLIR